MSERLFGELAAAEYPVKAAADGDPQTLSWLTKLRVLNDGYSVSIIYMAGGFAILTAWG